MSAKIVFLVVLSVFKENYPSISKATARQQI